MMSFEPDSRSIRRVEFYPDTGAMRIWFKSGHGPYDFAGVSLAKYHAFADAGSKGKFYWAQIHPYHRI